MFTLNVANNCRPKFKRKAIIATNLAGEKVKVEAVEILEPVCRRRTYRSRYKQESAFDFSGNSWYGKKKHPGGIMPLERLKMAPDFSKTDVDFFPAGVLSFSLSAYHHEQRMLRQQAHK